VQRGHGVVPAEKAPAIRLEEIEQLGHHLLVARPDGRIGGANVSNRVSRSSGSRRLTSSRSANARRH
jgi:hypothetical protein